MASSTASPRLATARRGPSGALQAGVLAIVAGACFALGIGAARLLSGEGGPSAAVAVPCEPPCDEGHECLQGICVAPPASMPAVADSAPASAPSTAAVEGEPLASVGMQRNNKCEGPLVPEAKCDHTAFPKMEYAMYGQAKRFTKCYLAARAEVPDLAGSIKVRLAIDFVAKTATASVDKKSNIEHPGLRKCVLDVMPGVIDYSWPHAWEKMWTSYQISFGIRPKE